MRFRLFAVSRSAVLAGGAGLLQTSCALEQLEERTLLAAGVSPQALLGDMSASPQQVVVAGDISVPLASPSDAGTVVSIPDPNLLMGIRNALKKPTGNITAGDMQSLTALRIEPHSFIGRPSMPEYYSPSGPVKDLTGLEWATNLTSLQLDYNQVTDVAPLRQLTSLTELSLDNNQITDITPLSSLTNLTTLELGSDLSVIGPYNDISDVTPLSGLRNLTALVLTGNQISDILPLSGLTRLTGLSVAANRITDIVPLRAMTKLTSLGLWQNPISDVLPLSGLTNLTELGLSNDWVTDITPLSGLTNLTQLWLEGNQVSDISVLGNLARLTTTTISHNYLDLQSGSSARSVIQGLLARGVNVTWTPQDTPPALVVSDNSGPSTDRSVALPGITVGFTSAPATFTLTNSGTHSLGINNFPIAAPTDFLLTVKDSSGNTINPINFMSIPGGQSYFIQVQLSPASIGSKAATISFSTNDLNNATVTLDLTGTAVAPGPRIQVSLISSLGSPPGPISFGTVIIGHHGPVKRFRVSNTGQQALRLGRFQLSKGFRFVGPLPTTLAPGKSATFAVQLLTNKAGTWAGAIKMPSNDPQQSLVVTPIFGVIKRSKRAPT